LKKNGGCPDNKIIGIRKEKQDFLVVCFVFVSFGGDWGLNLGLCTFKAGTPLLEAHLQSKIQFLKTII
jgi:hypothetical protein